MRGGEESELNEIGSTVLWSFVNESGSEDLHRPTLGSCCCALVPEGNKGKVGYTYLN